MTEQQDTTEVPEREIEFLGRKIWVRMPTPEQMLVWKRTATRLQRIEEQDWTGETVMAALERLRLIIDSVVLNQVDKDWMDDEMLEARLTMNQATEIIPLAVTAFSEPDNRAGRRAAKKVAPAKKATRKAAAR